MFKSSMLGVLSVCGALVFASPVALGQDKPEGDAAATGPLAGPPVEQRGDQRPGPRQFDGQMRRPAERERPLMRQLEGLNLTEEQREQVRQITQEHAEQVRKFREENAQELQRIGEALTEARQQQDREKARQLMQERRALQEKGPQPGALVEKIKQVLTAEQREAFEKQQAEERERAQERRREGRAEQGPDAQRRQELRERMRDMTPEQRRQFMEQQRRERQERQQQEQREQQRDRQE